MSPKSNDKSNPYHEWSDVCEGGEVVCVEGGDAVGPLSQARKINLLLYIFIKPLWGILQYITF